MVFPIIVFIFIFVFLFIWDSGIESRVNKLWAECFNLYERLEKERPSTFHKISSMYGKEIDEIGNRRPTDFPISMYYNLRDLDRLNYLYTRFHDELSS